jgi:SPW repeat-containing protein
MSLLRGARDGNGAAGRGAARTWALAGLLSLGVWLSVAPFALDYSGGPSRAIVNDTVVGVAVVGLALVGLCRPGR